MAKLFRSNRPDGWSLLRSYRDPSHRYMAHGPIQPMEQPGWFERLFHRR